MRCLLIVSALCTLAVAGEKAVTADVVNQFFPESLRGEASVDPELAFQSASVPFTPKGSKDTYLVAAYTNTSNGIVRLLAQRSGQWGVMGEWELGDMVTMPALSLQDFDGDGNDEVVAGFKAGGHSWDAQWIFRWNGTSLEKMVEQSQSNPVGSVWIHDVADLDGNGTSELIDTELVKDEACDCDYPWTPLFHVYSIDQHKFKRTRTLAYYESVPLVKKLPIVCDDTFKAADPAQKYVLRVVKAGDKGKWNVKSAQVRLNGALVVDGVHFSSKDPVILVPVRLLAANTISVQINALENRGATPAEPKERSLIVTIEQQ